MKLERQGGKRRNTLDLCINRGNQNIEFTLDDVRPRHIEEKPCLSYFNSDKVTELDHAFFQWNFHDTALAQCHCPQF